MDPDTVTPGYASDMRRTKEVRADNSLETLDLLINALDYRSIKHRKPIRSLYFYIYNNYRLR